MRTAHAERVLRALAACRRQHGVTNPVETFLATVEGRVYITPEKKKLWDAWTKLVYEARMLGLDVESIDVQADESEIKRRGRELRQRVDAVRKKEG